MSALGAEFRLSLRFVAERVDAILNLIVGEPDITNRKLPVERHAIDQILIALGYVNLRLQPLITSHHRLIRLHGKTQQIFHAPFVRHGVQIDRAPLVRAQVNHFTLRHDRRMQKSGRHFVQDHIAVRSIHYRRIHRMQWDRMARRAQRKIRRVRLAFHFQIIERPLEFPFRRKKPRQSFQRT